VGETADSTERERLAAHGVTPRKRFGQNFLLDPRIPELIVERADWRRTTPVLEIGAGSGALTAALLAAGHPVISVEIDRDLIAILLERFTAEREAGCWALIEGDLLALDPKRGPLGQALASLAPDDDPRPWVAGNLPYAITTPILEWTCRSRHRWDGAVFMVQREYGARILASPGGREIGSLTHWIAAQAQTRSLLRVGRSAFWPRPGVESVVLELKFPQPPPFTGDLVALERLLRAAFGQRRKTLVNSVAHGLGRPKGLLTAQITALGLAADIRGEMLSLSDFARLSEALAAAQVAPDSQA